MPPEDPIAISVAHCIEYWINRSTSSKLFSAWRQTLTRSFPFGTVGQVIGRAFSPWVLKRVANGRGYDVIKGTTGVGSCEGNDDDADGWRCSGSERIWGMIGVNEYRSRSVRVAVRYSQSAKTWRESCQGTATLAKQQTEYFSKASPYLVCAPRFQDIKRAVSRDYVCVAQGSRIYQRPSIVYQVLLD